jgi:PAS domain S-box-containing protein
MSDSFTPVSPTTAQQSLHADDANVAFATTVERAPVGIAHFDTQGRFLFANAQLCSIFGLPRSVLLTKTFHELSFPDDLPHCLALTAQLAANSIPRYAVEKRFLRPDGSTVYARVIVTAIRTPSGDISYFLGIVEDISDLWAAEQARRDAEARLALALNAADTGIYRYNFQSEVLDWSNGMARVFGFPENEPVQTLERMLGFIHPDDLPIVMRAYDQCVSSGADFDEHFRVIRPNGEIRWISDRAKVTHDAGGKALYLTGACTDVTALMDARSDAERASKVREEMMAVVAHDLRNPVHTIMLAAGAIADFDLSAEENSKQLALIRRAASGMDRLIRDLLDANQIEQGRLALSIEPVDIASLITEATSLAALRAAEAGLAIETNVAPGLPRVRADRVRIAQVMSNLLGNAIKFSPRGGRITVRAERDVEQVVVSITDTGQGISAAHLPHVFDRYWQAERTTTKGVGLGLAIVRGIIEGHGGRVWAESTPGAGSTFAFTLRVS